MLAACLVRASRMLARACLLAQEEESLKEMLEEEKRQYKEGFAQLKALKSEIEHLQHLLEQARARPRASARDPAPLCTGPRRLCT